LNYQTVYFLALSNKPKAFQKPMLIMLIKDKK